MRRIETYPYERRETMPHPFFCLVLCLSEKPLNALIDNSYGENQPKAFVQNLLHLVRFIFDEHSNRITKPALNEFVRTLREPWACGKKNYSVDDSFKDLLAIGVKELFVRLGEVGVWDSRGAFTVDAFEDFEFFDCLPDFFS